MTWTNRDLAAALRLQAQKAQRAKTASCGPTYYSYALQAANVIEQLCTEAEAANDRHARDVESVARAYESVAALSQQIIDMKAGVERCRKVVDAQADRIVELTVENRRVMGGINVAWVIINDAYDGDWSQGSSQWHQAAGQLQNEFQLTTPESESGDD